MRKISMSLFSIKNGNFDNCYGDNDSRQLGTEDNIIQYILMLLEVNLKRSEQKQGEGHALKIVTTEMTLNIASVDSSEYFGSSLAAIGVASAISKRYERSPGSREEMYPMVADIDESCMSERYVYLMHTFLWCRIEKSVL